MGGNRDGGVIKSITSAIPATFFPVPHFHFFSYECIFFSTYYTTHGLCVMIFLYLTDFHIQSVYGQRCMLASSWVFLFLSAWILSQSSYL